MVNQRSKFSPNLAEVTNPLRDLLNKGSEWLWGEHQQRAFEEVKKILTTSPVLALFDPNRETVISTDTLSYGLGVVHLQTQPDGEEKPVAYIHLCYGRCNSGSRYRMSQVNLLQTHCRELQRVSPLRPINSYNKK